MEVEKFISELYSIECRCKECWWSWLVQSDWMHKKQQTLAKATLWLPHSTASPVL